MKFNYVIIILAVMLISCMESSSEKSHFYDSSLDSVQNLSTDIVINDALADQSNIRINVPTAESESEYVWDLLENISFYNEYGYEISLPKGDIIDTLKNKAIDGSLTESDFDRLKLFMKDSVYKKSDYDVGNNKIKEQLPLIDNMISKLKEGDYNWKFKKFEIYRIDLTLYGPGGSYNVDDGSILLYTTSNGEFKQHINPGYTIIHEIVHIGIEESIIQKYNVPHTLKERIVDIFCLSSFKDYLPEYRMQYMGDERIDAYVSKTEDLKDLEKHVKQIMSTSD